MAANYKNPPILAKERKKERKRKKNNNNNKNNNKKRSKHNMSPKFCLAVIISQCFTSVGIVDQTKQLKNVGGLLWRVISCLSQFYGFQGLLNREYSNWKFIPLKF